MNEMIFTVSKKAVLAICLTFFAAQAFYGQSSWRTLNSSTSGDLVAVYFTSAERGFVAGDKGYFAQTTDGGKTWTKQFVYTEEDINEIYFRNDNNGYVVAGKKMFLTDDGGRSWREIKIYDPKNFRNF
jgi:photosystem II stability/assembly factor-like uncharacterized protein